MYLLERAFDVECDAKLRTRRVEWLPVGLQVNDLCSIASSHPAHECLGIGRCWQRPLLQNCVERKPRGALPELHATPARNTEGTPGGQQGDGNGDAHRP